jgi:hypothetical protein
MQRQAASERPRRRRRTCRPLAPSTSATQPVRVLLPPATTNRKARRPLAGHSPLHSMVPCRAVARSPRRRHQLVSGQHKSSPRQRAQKNLPTTSEWGTEVQADACGFGLAYGLGLQGLEATQTPSPPAAAGPVARAVQLDQTPCITKTQRKSERARAGGRPYRPARTGSKNPTPALHCTAAATHDHDHKYTLLLLLVGSSTSVRGSAGLPGCRFLKSREEGRHRSQQPKLSEDEGHHTSTPNLSESMHSQIRASRDGRVCAGVRKEPTGIRAGFPPQPRAERRWVLDRNSELSRYKAAASSRHGPRIV